MNVIGPGEAFDEWYKLAVAAGLVLAIGLGAAGSSGGVLLGVGMVVGGLGDFINHPYRERLTFGDDGEVTGKVYGRPRANSIGGITLCIVGALLALAGAVKLIVAG